MDPSHWDYLWVAGPRAEWPSMESVGVDVDLYELAPETGWSARKIELSESMIIDSLTKKPGRNRLAIPDAPYEAAFLDSLSRKRTPLREILDRFQNWPSAMEAGRLTRTDFLKAWEFATTHSLGPWHGLLH
ncbi:MAG: hypothetical protein R8F63_10380 [Acidimicrobiales bacterium]|nr:hypothetical protein [Acidimicrobiales bacterium]